ncbi:class I SAM-dependent methyltransferase [Mycolicibacterium hippocampi]|uniref:SAM-dependent methyltransferase n=1 Tax=Mycolicibacterium hippocampi TaxID=659824 RepID=A0A7I9ZR91_9MYCO|nr:class I SAM-dependent methyltransferase [Mycolicibacterium hippocampi]GFH03515.1 SAM-dependent methyltransferase [Mycolicibacterium hippocampi]
MSDEDRVRWDRRYTDRGLVTLDEPALPAVFQPFADEFPTTGCALDLACGTGGAAVWLAQRGMAVWGCDVSAVAISHARALAERCGVTARCHFQVCDLDNGLPAGSPADVLICNMFRDARLDQAIIGRIAPGGLLAVSALSEVGASPGSFRARAGELRRAFAGLDVIAGEEAHGRAWLLARAVKTVDRTPE